MKKILVYLSFALIIATFQVGCTKTNDGEAIFKAISDATNEVETAKTEKEVQQIALRLRNTITGIIDEKGDLTTEEMQDSLVMAATLFSEDCTKKIRELVNNK